VRTDSDQRKPPIVLVHGFALSVRWWDRVTPRLARDHYVIRVDLLGHGGSEKPREGYSMEEQADRVAAVLDRLKIDRVTYVAHSMGGFVGTALVERHRARVARMMTIGTPPEVDSSKTNIIRAAAGMPVIGPTLRQVIPERMIRAQVEETFIPRFDPPQRLIDDIERTTFTSYRESSRASSDYREEQPLPQRLADEGVPLTVVYGTEDSVVDPDSAGRFRLVPGARLVEARGLGPNLHVEAPKRTAALIAAFAVG
jgi:pimeloyl-ACP methyl ester carboxylesterase